MVEKKERAKRNSNPTKKKWFDILFYSMSAVVILVLLFIGLRQRGWLPLWIDNLPSSQISEISEEIRERRSEFNIINAHEHVQSEENIPMLRKAMEDCQVEKIVMLGTSDFTFFLDPEYGFTGYEENNETIIGISNKYPDIFAALVTMDPRDEDKLEKLKKYIADGAAGVKLYNGHGSFYDMFFNMPLDDPGMMEVYEYCEQEGIPILHHINTGRFLTEMEHVLQEFPDLVQVVPHFMLSSSNLSRLTRLMNEYPQLYTDISFGHPDFLVAGFGRISNNYLAFREFMKNYRDRITYGTDLVVTTYKAKTRAYIDDVHLAYMDLLEEDEFTLPKSIYSMMTADAKKNIDQDRVFRGLNLDDETLQMIYHDNAKKLFFQ
ncbi:MAG TPA: amidohydrolase family protein [Atribacterota bacterium]|nr:amidohydrolase family protein [Atribacterota bacterium]